MTADGESNLPASTFEGEARKLELPLKLVQRVRKAVALRLGRSVQDLFGFLLELASKPKGSGR